MKKELDINSWNRKEHYLFFKNFDNPFYNICTKIEVTDLLKFCKEEKLSFFLSILYLSIQAANEVEEFRIRIEGDRIFVYDKIHPFSTILNDDNTFSFCEFDYVNPFAEFSSKGQLAIERTIKEKILAPKDERNDVIHYTTIPWIELTGLTHARNFNTGDSIPKFVFGKYYQENSKTFIPFCVEVHHSLVDGYHIGCLLERLNKLTKDCKNILSDRNG